MYKNCGIVLPLSAQPVARFLRDLEKYKKMDGFFTPVYKERNVYKMRIRVPSENNRHEEFRIDTDDDTKMTDDMEVGKFEKGTAARMPDFHRQPTDRA